MKQREDLIRELTVTLKMSSEKIETIFDAFEKNSPKLSDADIDKIAEAVAKKLTTSPELRSPLKESLMTILLNVTSSGLWQFVFWLGCYLTNYMGGANEISDEQIAERSHRLEVAYRLTTGLTEDVSKDLEASAGLLELVANEWMRELADELNGDSACLALAANKGGDDNPEFWNRWVVSQVFDELRIITKKREVL